MTNELILCLIASLIIAAVYYFYSGEMEKKAVEMEKKEAVKEAARHGWNRTNFENYVNKIGFEETEVECLWTKFLRVCFVGNAQYFWKNYTRGNQNYFLQHLKLLQVENLPENVKQKIIKGNIKSLKSDFKKYFTKEYINSACQVFENYDKLFCMWNNSEYTPYGLIAAIIMSYDISKVKEVPDDERCNHLYSLCKAAGLEH